MERLASLKIQRITPPPLGSDRYLFISEHDAQMVYGSETYEMYNMVGNWPFRCVVNTEVEPGTVCIPTTLGYAFLLDGQNAVMLKNDPPPTNDPSITKVVMGVVFCGRPGDFSLFEQMHDDMRAALLLDSVPVSLGVGQRLYGWCGTVRMRFTVMELCGARSDKSTVKLTPSTPIDFVQQPTNTRLRASVEYVQTIDIRKVPEQHRAYNASSWFVSCADADAAGCEIDERFHIMVNGMPYSCIAHSGVPKGTIHIPLRCYMEAFPRTTIPIVPVHVTHHNATAIEFEMKYRDHVNDVCFYTISQQELLDALRQTALPCFLALGQSVFGTVRGLRAAFKVQNMVHDPATCPIALFTNEMPVSFVPKHGYIITNK